MIRIKQSFSFDLSSTENFVSVKKDCRDRNQHMSNQVDRGELFQSRIIYFVLGEISCFICLDFDAEAPLLLHPDFLVPHFNTTGSLPGLT